MALLIFEFKFAKGSSEELLLTEIMYKPGKDKPEWIELVAQSDFNLSKKSSSCAKDCQLKDFYICAKVSKSDLKCLSSYPAYAVGEKIPVIKKGDFIIITKYPEFFSQEPDKYSGILLKSNFNLLENDDASLAYSFDSKVTWKGITFYSDFYKEQVEGRSLERIDLSDRSNEKKNWQESFWPDGTPGSKSSFKRKYDQKIYINEIYPHLKDKSEEEFIELYNSNSNDEVLNGWKLEDKAGKKCLLDKRIIEAEEYLVVKNDPESDCAVSLNDTSEEVVYLRDPNNDIVAETFPYKAAKEGLSYSFDGKIWHWSKFLTPGKENILEDIPNGKLLIDEDIYEDVYDDFSIKGLSKNAKVSWDFGDGHKSYKAVTSHKYIKKGKYIGSVKYSEGSEDIVKEFEINVEEFPKPKVKIIEVNPNPIGSDTANETITIQNKSKKKINLLGWSIATGWKKFINHPIRQDFIIEKGKTKTLTRNLSSFALNNKKDKIELRYPDGEVASKLKYKKEEGIEEGEIYKKVKDGWQWSESQKSIKFIGTIKQQEEESFAIGFVEIKNESSVISNQSSENNNQELEKETERIIEKELDIEILKNHSDFKILDEIKSFKDIDIREEDGRYFLTLKTPEQEHYTIVFLSELLSKANIKLNNFMGYFSK